MGTAARMRPMPGKAEQSTLLLGTEDGTFHFSYEKYLDFKTQDQIVPHPADFLILVKL